ncbi:MAG: cob(I)yrinic acid a,c-diamide adenosyltransferase [Candidatus Cloacimonetes bacterium]|nr:cob(I)yrinic acid a,c-diamide adenosyltransferase [Candidatus Cloacimonadota bacterium]
MLQIYTGNGKGKTTASLGLATRALGHNKKVCLIQFMKKDYGYGEIDFFQNIKNIDIFQFGTPEFVNKNNPAEIDLDEAEKAIKKAKEVLQTKKYDVVILDEINVALNFELIPLKHVMELLDLRQDTEVILTGRYADPELIKKADLVTEMKEIKHYFKNGMEARKGIEF